MTLFCIGHKTSLAHTHLADCLQGVYKSIAGNGWEKWSSTFAKKVVDQALLREDSLGEALAYLRERRQQSTLAKGPKLPQEELDFWEDRISFMREMLGAKKLPVTETTIEERPFPYLMLLHEGLENINVGAQFLPLPGEQIPKAYNLMPQAVIANKHIKVLFSPFNLNSCCSDLSQSAISALY